MSTEPTNHTSKDTQDDAANPSTDNADWPFLPQTEVARLREVETALKRALKLHLVLTYVANQRCQDCQPDLVKQELNRIHHAFKALKAYAEYLSPGTAGYLRLFD